MRIPAPLPRAFIICFFLWIQRIQSFTVTSSQTPVCLRLEASKDAAALGKDISISSPVLKQVYPAMLKHIENHGNPNIPLGSSEGRMCQTLRRLRTQEKLPESDVAILDDLGFVWHSLEDVYKNADFDELYQRLLEYGGDYSPPKKYPDDPELGAWVTGIRRVGEANVETDHRIRLNEIGFQWISPRKCGSAFMQQYRDLCSQLESAEEPSDVLGQPVIKEWIRAQQQAVARGTLSETRKHYLEEILGEDWLESLKP